MIDEPPLGFSAYNSLAVSENTKKDPRIMAISINPPVAQIFQEKTTY